VRAGWRRSENQQRLSQAPETNETTLQRESDALSSTDRVREQAPDDVETRRRADELEREIRQSRRSR
jgi:hypothetical protein